MASLVAPPALDDDAATIGDDAKAKPRRRRLKKKTSAIDVSAPDAAYPPTERRWSVGPRVAMFFKRTASAFQRRRNRPKRSSSRRNSGRRRRYPNATDRRRTTDGRGQGAFIDEDVDVGERCVRAAPALPVVFDGFTKSLCSFCFGAGDATQAWAAPTPVTTATPNDASVSVRGSRVYSFFSSEARDPAVR